MNVQRQGSRLSIGLDDVRLQLYISSTVLAECNLLSA